MSGNLKSVFEYELHRKLSLKTKSINSEMNLLINSFKFYDIDEIGVITKENWSKVFVRVGLTGFSENNFNELFDLYDPNRTGVINYKNLTYYLYNIAPYQPFQDNQNLNTNTSNLIVNRNSNVFMDNMRKNIPFEPQFNRRQQRLKQNHSDIFNQMSQVDNYNNFQRFKPITPLDNNMNMRDNYHNMNNMDRNSNMNIMNNMNTNNKINMDNMNIDMNNNIKMNSNINMNNMNMGNMSVNNNINMNNMNINNNMNMENNMVRSMSGNMNDPMMNEPNQIPIQNNPQDNLNDNVGMKRYFQNLLQLFQSKINTNNGITYYNLVSKLKDKQDKMLKAITYEDLLLSIKEAKIELNDIDVRDFFTLLDLTEKNKVSTEEILRLLRGFLSERRKMLIIEKFAKIDIDRKGYAEINLIKSLFNPNAHPDVLMNKKSEGEVFEEFIFTFDTFISFKEKINEITFEDFIEYYSAISAAILNEDYFTDMMNGVWSSSMNYHNKDNNNVSNNVNLQQEQININPQTQINQNQNQLNQQITEDNQFQNRRPQSFNPIMKNEEQYNTLSGQLDTGNKVLNSLNDQIEVYYNQNNQLLDSSNPNSNTVIMKKNNFSIENSGEINTQSINTIDKLRNMLISRGPKSLFIIEKMISMYDNNHSGKIDFPTFEKIITLYRLSLTPDEIVTIFSSFDNGTGKINYDDLIRNLIGSLTPRREQLIKKIFNLISNGRNEIAINELKSNYNASRDPEVVARKKLPEEVIGDFTDNLEIFREYNASISKSNPGFLNFVDFMKFYSQISLGISDDNYFEYLVNNVWNLDGGNANNFYNYGKNIFEQRARSAYNKY